MDGEPETKIMEDFVADAVTATTEELTDIEIVAEVVQEFPAASSEPSPADAEDSVPLPSSSEAVAAMALLRRYCSAIEGSSLALVDCLDTVKQAVATYAMSSKKQFFSPK